MLPKTIHLHKNRINNSLSVFLILIPAIIFAIVAILTYSYLIGSKYKNRAFDVNNNSAVLGEEITK